MALRLGRLVGLACVALVLARLGRVLSAGADTTDWRWLGLAASTVGGFVTWVSLTHHLSRLRMAALHLVGLALLVLRITAAPTLTLGVVPGAETLGTVATELDYALEILQFGAPPVLAVPGLLALVAVGLWLLGAGWAWGATNGRVWLGILPPLAFYLYLSVVDRAPGGAGWHLMLAILASLGLLATSLVSRAGSGRVRDVSNRPLPRRRIGASAAVVAMVIAGGLGGATALAGAIPGSGTIDWRNPGGSGSGLGDGVSFNRFVGLRQSVLSESDTPVFVARVEGASTPTRQMYWKLLTLDVYDGAFWRAADVAFSPIAEESVWEDPALAYRGETIAISQTIRIEALRDDRLPALYSPVGLSSDSDVVASGAEVGDDASLRVNALTFDGLTYRVDSEVPTLDVAALASRDGELTPLFEAAAAEGRFQGAAIEGVTPVRPAAIEALLAVPEDLDPAIEGLAREVTAAASSPFEQALFLEDFLRGFDYDTNVTTGHSALDLAEWLTVPASPNYRTGYCEQFATAMGVMGRLLGLPTRVVMGFTHGEQVDTADGPVTVVRQRNAHAWVEVWFDQEGWVRFDPTPRGDGTTAPAAETIGFDPGSVELPDTGDRNGVTGPLPSGLGDISFPGDDLQGIQSPLGGSDVGRWLAVVAAMATVAAVASSVPAIKGIRRQRRLRRAREGDIAAVWDEIVDRLFDLGQGPAAHVTPLEFASSVHSTLVPLARAYSAAIYGGRAADGALGYMESAERWLGTSFGGRRRAQATFSLRSLTKR